MARPSTPRSHQAHGTITRRYIAPEEVEGYVAEWTDLRTILTVVPDHIVSWSAGG